MKHQEVVDWGKSYEVRLRLFLFPTKSYEILSCLPEKEALRVIIEKETTKLWCVLFPLSCFVDISTSLAKDNATPR